jgi:hypothetical protein
MTRPLALALILWSMAGLAGVSAAEPLAAVLEKVRGKVTESGSGTAITTLNTGDFVYPGRAVTVSRLSVAMYKIGQQFVLKQAPHSTMSFSGISRPPRAPNGYPICEVQINLTTGDLYSALKPPRQTQLDYRITTSRIEAIAHNAVFRVTHSFSTSIVYVMSGEVEVLYCYLNKRTIVHPGEAFTVTDCDGYVRWQTEEESRDMTLFAALTDAGFNTQYAMLALTRAGLDPQIPVNFPLGSTLSSSSTTPTGVLGPTVPPNLPVVSP